MVLATTVSNFPIRVKPLNNITPFSYRDGETYLEELERLKKFAGETLPDAFNAELERIIAEFNSGLGEWDSRFTEFMGGLNALIGQLNDTAIAALIDNEISATRLALDQAIDERTESYLSFVERQIASIDFTGNASSLTVANNTSAAKAAVMAGGDVAFPSGTFITNGEIGIPSRTRVHGKGEDITTMKIADGNGWDTRGFYHIPGSTRSSLSNLTVDGNQANRNHSGGRGGIYGTNVSCVNSTHIRWENVKSINAMQHGFDVTSSYYYNAGDGAVVPVSDMSQHVTVLNCSGAETGDDCISTHGSRYVTIINFQGKGTWKKNDVSYTNSNGLEVDDYSENVTVIGGHFEGFAHGIEIKAHGTMSAGRHVLLLGTTCVRNEVNYSLRHIGHHVNYPGNPAELSLTAENVQLIGCISLYPARVFYGGIDQVDGDVPDDETPPGDQYHHMVIGAYVGVTVKDFSYTSDPTFNYAGSSAILLHFLAEDITLDGTQGEGHTTGKYDIHSTGGDQPAKNIKIINSTIRDSAPSGISCGSVAGANILNNSIQRDVPGSENLIAIRAFGNNVIRNNDVIGTWKANYQVSSTYYSTYETPMATNVAYAVQPVFPE